ncbi:isochorismatase family protein [Marinicellulosiphila megalodicopiae]|uniref:isochorismatase family protein n=1 Tax=Marinicellulosiphila megalodicopiae TaxID=2724896 RepID=UPI003BB04EDE
MSIPKITQYPLSGALNNIENKTTWKIDPKKSILLIHDMQNYFVNFYDDNGELIKTIVNNIVELKKWCVLHAIPVFYTAQPGNQDQKERALLTDFWGKGLDGSDNKPDIIDQLKPTDNDVVLNKWRYSAFKKSNLEQTMKQSGRDQLIVCGIYAHIGVLSTALDAFMYDIKPFVIADAVADFTQEEHTMAMQYISKRCGNVYTLEQLKKQIPSKNKVSLEAICNDAAVVLSMPVDEVDADEEFMYLGLDSIRMMTLIQQWNEKGWGGDFSQLAQAATLRELYNVLVAQASIDHDEIHSELA